MPVDEIVAELERLGSPEAVAGMARFGIRSNSAFGVSMPQLRKLARRIGRDHTLATRLWQTGNHDARILASLVGDADRITEEQMEQWAGDFDTWAVCDACCMNLFDKAPLAYRKAIEWSKREEEYVKRAGFALMAALAAHDKNAGDAKFLQFFPAIRAAAPDDRNFVRKAVNWALRQIGKRNRKLNDAAIHTAREIRGTGCRSARWIAADALRELESAAVQRRLK